MTEPKNEPLRPEIPEDLGAVGVLLGLARAFMPAFALPKLVSEPPVKVPEESPEARMRKAEARYQTLVEQIPAVTFMASFENGLSEIYVSPHIEALLGYTAREWIEDPILWYQRLHPDEKERWTREFSRTISWAEPFKADYRFLAKDGRVVWIHGEARVVRNQLGMPSFVQGIGYDITDLKNAEEVLRRSQEELEVLVQKRTAALAAATESLEAEIIERNRIEAELRQARDDALVAARQKAEFLANMSHEIRTPMNGVIGMTELLLNTPMTEQQRDFAHTILTSAEALLTIINDILDFSKLEAGKMTVEMSDFNLRECVEIAAELLAVPANTKNIELVHVFEPGVPAEVRGDSGRVAQVLLNLVGNAIKFTHSGEIVVTVSKLSERAGRVLLMFEVRDTGIGITLEAQGRLFQAFSQADGSTTRKYGGTGLGLAISKQLVTIMGGEIGVRSAPGQGSIFWFTIQFQNAAAVAREPLPEKAGSLAGVRVLIVDDNETNRKVLHHQLQEWGMLDSLATSGAEGLEMLRDAQRKDSPFKFALLDMQMPEMDGISLAHTIKGDPSIASTRLVLLSSISHQLDAETLRAAQIEASLSKPIRQARLFDCLTGLLGPVNAARGAKQAPVPIPKTPGAEHVRILVAEDNVINQQVVMGQLRTLGYDADAVASGKEVLAALEMFSYHIILMDCQMPEMDGYEATRRIRQIENEQERKSRLHVVAMTANAMHEDRERCISAGMDDYLTKPLRSTELRAALERSRQLDSARVLSGSSAEGPILDLHVIADLSRISSEDGTPALNKLIDMFLETAPAHVADIRSFARMPERMAPAAHLFRGICLNLGASRLAEICQRLENAPLDSDGMQLQQLLQAMDKALEETRASFRELRI